MLGRTEARWSALRFSGGPQTKKDSRKLPPQEVGRLAAAVLGQNNATVTIMDYDTAVAPFRRTDGSVTLVLAVTGKRWLVVGGFTDVDGYQRNGLARLETDGALDTSFDPAQSADGPIVTAVEQHDGKVLVGGSFLNFATQPRFSVARIMANGALDNTFVPQIKGPCSVQELLLQSDGKVLVAGSGLSTAAVTNTGLLRLNTDGSVDLGFVPPSGITNAQVISLQADGKVLVTGPFGLIMRLNPDGSADPGFAAQLPTNQGLAMAGVSSIAPFPDGRILLGGSPYYTEKDMALVTLSTNGDLAAVQLSLRVPNSVGPGLARNGLRNPCLRLSTRWAFATKRLLANQLRGRNRHFAPEPRSDSGSYFCLVAWRVLVDVDPTRRNLRWHKKPHSTEQNGGGKDLHTPSRRTHRARSEVFRNRSLARWRNSLWVARLRPIGRRDANVHRPDELVHDNKFQCDGAGHGVPGDNSHQ